MKLKILAESLKESIQKCSNMALSILCNFKISSATKDVGFDFIASEGESTRDSQRKYIKPRKYNTRFSFDKPF